MTEDGRRLIIFDNDGVLVDSEPHAHPVLVRLLNEYGFPLTLEASGDAFLGVSISHVRAAVEAELGRPLPDDFEQRYHSELFASFEHGLHAFEGVHQVLARLRAPYCVASSGSTNRIQRSLSITGLWSFFEGRAFSADSVARGKPHPDLFLHASHVMGFDADACLVVEDSPAGVEAARRAGMQCVGFAARTPADRLSAATFGIVHGMDDLSDALERFTR